MKKIILFILITGISISNMAQSKLGIKVSPQLSTSFSSLVDSTYDVESAGPGFKFAMGLIFDHEISETYYFSTGVILLPKRFALDISTENGDSLPSTLNAMEEYRLNYLQIPLSLKMFTNEIQPDLRIYFQVGVAAEIKIFQAALEEEYDLVAEFTAVDLAVPIFGVGTEYRAGLNTILFAGFTYQRGLLNQVKTLNFNFQNELSVRNTVVSLDLGIKF